MHNILENKSIVIDFIRLFFFCGQPSTDIGSLKFSICYVQTSQEWTQFAMRLKTQIFHG